MSDREFFFDCHLRNINDNSFLGDNCGHANAGKWTDFYKARKKQVEGAKDGQI
jgi:hypothetical protein